MTRLQGPLRRQDPFVRDLTCSATLGDGWVDTVLCIQTPHSGDFCLVLPRRCEDVVQRGGCTPGPLLLAKEGLCEPTWLGKEGSMESIKH